MDPTRQLVSDSDPATETEDYYTGMFSNFLPISITTVGNTELQNYYETTNKKIASSAPNTINLKFSVAIHPRPYPSDDSAYTRFSYEESEGVWGYTNNGLQLFDKQDEDDITFFQHTINPASPFDLTSTSEYLITTLDENYFRYFVID